MLRNDLWRAARRRTAPGVTPNPMCAVYTSRQLVRMNVAHTPVCKQLCRRFFPTGSMGEKQQNCSSAMLIQSGKFEFLMRPTLEIREFHSLGPLSNWVIDSRYPRYDNMQTNADKHTYDSLYMSHNPWMCSRLRLKIEAAHV